MNSTIQRLPLTFQIAFASLIAGFVSLLSNPEGTSHWTDKFWIISIASHCVLIAITFWIFQEEKLRLNTKAGHFNTFTLALISSLTALFLVVLSWYVPFALIITGRAFLTAFIATYLYAFLRTIE